MLFKAIIVDVIESLWLIMVLFILSHHAGWPPHVAEILGVYGTFCFSYIGALHGFFEYLEACTDILVVQRKRLVLISFSQPNPLLV